jgi:tetratricopeptide (TPR) repeat protein
VRDWLAELPPAVRWAILGALGLLVVTALAGAVLSYLESREAGARRAFAEASQTYRDAMASRDAGALEKAASALSAFANAHSRGPLAAQAWYLLGNVEYQRQQMDAALKAFGEAAGRGSPTVATLSRLGLGYAWEAKGDPGKALEAYTEALKGRRAQDFLYADLMLATARAQEQMKQPAAAIKTYQEILKQAPADATRGDEIRARLAILGATSS